MKCLHATKICYGIFLNSVKHSFGVFSGRNPIACDSTGKANDQWSPVELCLSLVASHIDLPTKAIDPMEVKC